MDVPGWPLIFRGSAAVRAGLVTARRLQGPAFVRVLPDTWAARHLVPLGHADRCRAVSRWSGGRGVIAGWAAAELSGAPCAPAGAPAGAPVEVLLPVRARAPAGVRVRRDRLHPGEIEWRDGIRVTTPLRTAFDLARGEDETDAVVAVDALAFRHGFSPDLLLHFAVRYRGLRGVSRVPGVLGLADRRAASPPETRLRLLLVRAGLPRPQAQHPVRDDVRRRAVWLDLAYPAARVGIEYEGADHTGPDRVLRDAARVTRLVDAGWRIYRYTRFDLRDEPGRIVAEIGRALDHAPSGTS
ncbi:hypothetical protein [Pseudonocardia sp. Ae505_Ps2]|uniref:hypothetical protein n=1 Tax=Pseudonocardia sp. Ae505_Ps2 TaxID=1885034 RepID=UPI00094EF575|nr:hypothetical protein [Pseudonocardia sp. Ae505_Ps2]